MQISELTSRFIASYITGVLPSLSDIRSEVDNKSLQDHVGICYEVALKRWCASSIVRERIALKKFSTLDQLRDCYNSEDWKQYKYIAKSFVKAWADELAKDFDCVRFIQQFDITDADDYLDSLIVFLNEELWRMAWAFRLFYVILQQISNYNKFYNEK